MHYSKLQIEVGQGALLALRPCPPNMYHIVVKLVGNSRGPLLPGLPRCQVKLPNGTITQVLLRDIIITGYGALPKQKPKTKRKTRTVPKVTNPIVTQW